MSALVVGARDLADALWNVAPHADPKDAEPALRHLLLRADRDGLHVSATDRFTLAEQTVQVRDGDVVGAGAKTECLLLATAAKRLVRDLDAWSARKPEPAAAVDLAGGCVHAGVAIHALALAVAEAPYPRYDALWPGPADVPAPRTSLGLTARHLARYADLRLHGDRRRVTGELRLTFGAKPGGPIAVEPVGLTGRAEFRSLLMPARLVAGEAS